MAQSFPIVNSFKRNSPASIINTYIRFLLKSILDERKVHILAIILILSDTRIGGNRPSDEAGGGCTRYFRCLFSFSRRC